MDTTTDALDATAPATARNRRPVSVTLVGGPTAVVEVGGVRFLTDPTFDPPGIYPVGSRQLVKTEPPALAMADVLPIDVVLLSHDQHPDNLDAAGRELLTSAPLVLSTASAAARLGAAVPRLQALPPWHDVELTSASRAGTVRVTAVPAQHGPDGTEHLTGEVTGFVISGDDVPTIYVSGDNASLDVVDEIARRFPSIDVAVLFAGGAQTPLLGDAYLTLSSDMAVQAALLLGTPVVIPVHTDGWGHFTQGVRTVEAAFASAGMSDRLLALRRGETARV